MSRAESRRRQLPGVMRVLALMAVDAACLVGVWAFTVWAYRAFGPGHYKYGAEFYLRLWPVVLVYVALNAMFRLYHGSVMHPAAPVSPPEELRRLVGSSVLTHLGLIAYLALAYQTTEDYSRAVIVISGFLSAVLAQPSRDLARLIAFRFDALRIPVILAGEGDLVHRLGRSLSLNPYLGFRVVRTLGADIAEIAAAADETGVRTLVSCIDPRLLRCQMPELVRRFAHIEYMPSGSSFPVSGGQIVSFDGVGCIEMVNQRHFSILRTEKRVLDSVLALAAFVLLLPFFLLVHRHNVALDEHGAEVPIPPYLC